MDDFDFINGIIVTLYCNIVAWNVQQLAYLSKTIAQQD